MAKRLFELEGHYLIKETGDILRYCGETLTDPHKGEYDSEYQVVIPSQFKKHDRLCDYELYNRTTRTQYSLIKLPNNIDLDNININTIKVLYGK